jgi:hypothetical protein
VQTEPHRHAVSKISEGDDIPVPAEDFDDTSCCMAVPDCRINGNASITTPAGATYQINARMYGLQQYLTRIGMGHAFGKMLDQSAFSIDDLTLIDDEKDLIEMGFSLPHERQLLLREIADLKTLGEEEVRTAYAEINGKLLELTYVTRSRRMDCTDPFPVATAAGSSDSGGGGGGGIGNDKASSVNQQETSQPSTRKITPLAELKKMRCVGLLHSCLPACQWPHCR